MMAQMEFAGGRKDIDKKLEKMNVDEKEVFNLIDGDEINDFRQPGFEITADKIKNNLNLENVLKNAFKNVDGGYNMVGLIGDGNAFVMRDPNGIRPNYYWENDEVVVVASERSAIQTAFDLQMDDLKEVTPGSALIIARDGSLEEKEILAPLDRFSCSFERLSRPLQQIGQ